MTTTTASTTPHSFECVEPDKTTTNPEHHQYFTHLKDIEIDRLHHIGFTSQQDLSMFKHVSSVVFHSTMLGAREFALDAAVTKLLYWSGTNLSKLSVYLLSTSTGLGIKAGTIILTTKSRDGLLEPGYVRTACGFQKRVPGESHDALRSDVHNYFKENYDAGVKVGETVGTDDFFEAQGVNTGLFPPPVEVRARFLKDALEMNVVSFDVCTPMFLSFCQELNIKAVAMSTIIRNALDKKGQATFVSMKQIDEYEQTLSTLFMNYLIPEEKQSQLLKTGTEPPAKRQKEEFLDRLLSELG